MRVLVVTVLAGCNSIYGLESTTVAPPQDAFSYEPPNCPTIRFGAPVLLGDFVDGEEFDGQLSAEGRELWFVVQDQGFDTPYRGTRPDQTSTFTVERHPFPNVPYLFDPSLTADGRRLMFVAQANGNSDVYEAVRSDATSADFESVRSVVGLLDFNEGIESLDVSWDGLRLYYTGGGGRLYLTERAGRDDPFGYSTWLMKDDPTLFAFPSVSPDELEIFYNHHEEKTHNLYYRNRLSTAEPFGPEQIVLNDGGDPDVAPGSETLVVSRANALFILERECGAKK